jgi:MFS family permease
MNRTESKTIWNKHFIIALTGYYFLFMSVSLFFIFPVYFEQFKASKSRIGLIMSINSLIIIVIRPFFGKLIDIEGRKKYSLIGIFLMMISYPFFHLIHDAGWLPLLLRAFTGVGWGIGMTAVMTMCSDLAPAERLAHSMGVIGIAGLVSQAVGPALAEELVNKYGFGGLFNAAFLFTLASFLCIYIAPETKFIANNHKNSNEKILQNISLSTFIIICSLPLFHGGGRGAIIYFISLFTKSINIEKVSPFFITFSIAAIITRLGLGDLSDKYGRKKIIFPGIILICFNLILISQINGMTMLYITGFIGGLGQGLFFPALSTYIIDILGHKHKGFAISLYLTLFDIGLGLGTPFFGKIIDMFNYRVMYILTSLLLIIVSTIFMIKAPTPSKQNN